MRVASWYCVIVGSLMVLQWALSLAAGEVPELRTAPVEIAMHLAAELMTAFGLVAAGISMLRGRKSARPVALFALGMLVYTIIQSPGYFAARGDWPMVALFGALFVGGLWAALQIARDPGLIPPHDSNARR